jgi:hypothetical protein
MDYYAGMIALGGLARKRTHQFIQQRIAARFRFTRVRIRGAVSHEVEMAPPMNPAPRRILASRLTAAVPKLFAVSDRSVDNRASIVGYVGGSTG